jgi:peptidyl-dipeptidase Dcp
VGARLLVGVLSGGKEAASVAFRCGRMFERMTMENPFFEPSPLPYQLPRFAEIRFEHYRPAFERGMAEQLAEVDAIVQNSESATFENTVVAMERSGQVLERVSAVFNNQTGSDSTPELRELDKELSPRLAAHRDAIHLNGALYARIAAVYEQRDSLGLDAEGIRLVERYHTDFVRAGARLSEADKERLRSLNEQIAAACTEFEQNLFNDTASLSPVFDTAAELEGLSDDAIAAAAANATARGHDGKFLISLKLPTNQFEIAALARRDVRERLLAASMARGRTSNRDLVPRIARLRAEHAALLGYASHAAYQVENQMAKTPEAVEDLLAKLVPAAVANAVRERELLYAAFEADGFEPADFAPWDWSYYAEKARKATFDVDEAELRPYLELERVVQDGVFNAANQLYGISFTERPDLVAYHPDARVFEVFDRDGSSLGLFIADYYARASKRGGAWMNELVNQSALLGTKPVVVNNLNIAKPPAGEPTLLNTDEVRTLFHEFGHALHGLFSDVRYPYFGGTSVPRDLVEFPSQVNEMWQDYPEILASYAQHVTTGEPIPADLLERMRAAEKFGEGFRIVEYLGAALLDWAWHTLAPDAVPGAIEDFETAALDQAGILFPHIPPRYLSTYLAHAFSFDYSAGYYAYIWSEVLDADTVEWFHESGGLTRENGDKFRASLLSRGGSVDGMDAYRSYRGRDPQIEPLLKRRGLA